MSASASAVSIKGLLGDAFANSLSVDGVGALLFRMIDSYVQHLHEPCKDFVLRLRGAESYRKELNEVLKRFRKAEEKRGKAELAVAKEATKNARIAFSGCLVLLAYENCRSSMPNMMFGSEEFGAQYWELGHDEILIAFRNFMMISLLLEPAKNNKAMHIDICARLSERDSTVHYVTGSGQSRATSKRVKIYEREGNISPEPSRKSKRSADESDASSVETDSFPGSKRSRGTSVSSDSSISSEGTVSALAGDFSALATTVPAAHVPAEVSCDASDLISDLDLNEFSLDDEIAPDCELVSHDEYQNNQVDNVNCEDSFDDIIEVLPDDDFWGLPM